MNLNSPWSAVSKFMFRTALKCRKLLPKQKSTAFGAFDGDRQSRIGHIFVINLDRQPGRLANMEKELRGVLDCSAVELWNLTERYTAIDAANFSTDTIKDESIDSVYTLGDQLFVEPQPLTLPTKFELDSPIHMSRPEIAIALSHIDVWRRVKAGDHEYVLILEDDVWLRPGFAQHVNQAWAEINNEATGKSNFDILYLSYEEVKDGAPKTFLSNNVFQPVRGLWFLAGYVLSREGAEKLLSLLPCKGPIDLWINHQFESIDVRAIRRPVVCQRRDVVSTNSYSVLPTLTKIGAINSGHASLFHVRPSEQPVFAFGSKKSGLSSLAMALSMLGYRCCSDLQALPDIELSALLEGSNNRVFHAYVNIGFLENNIHVLRDCYPDAKFILTRTESEVSDSNFLRTLNSFAGLDTIILDSGAKNKWQVICEHLGCVPPACLFPELDELGRRQLACGANETGEALSQKVLKRDNSPWVIEADQLWQGISIASSEDYAENEEEIIGLNGNFEFHGTEFLYARDDTFTDNLALFRPSNIGFSSGFGTVLSVKKEPLGVREYSAAALTSYSQYLYGSFEAVIKASNVSGVVTGVFLYRDSPRQEIDIEIAGNRPDHLLVNVFYNPGAENAKFDYGYRGAASSIELGFDASQAYHRFSIEWRPDEICWFVDDRLVHKRVLWNPTPIPHLPMAFHVNIWPSRSKELAGRFASRRLPANTYVKSIALEAKCYENTFLQA